MITRPRALPLFLKEFGPPGIAARGGSLITEIFNFAHAAAGLFERQRDISSKNMTSTLSQRTSKTKVQSPKTKKVEIKSFSTWRDKERYCKTCAIIRTRILKVKVFSEAWQQPQPQILRRRS